MTDKTPLGIPVLDDDLGGGIPRGYVILLEVDTGTRLDAFISTFMATGLDKGELAYILCTESPLRFPYEQLQKKGIEVEKALKAKKLLGIDAFTDAFGWGEFTPEGKYTVHDLSNTRHVHDIIRKAVLAMKPKNNLRGVIDSLTSILHAARDPDEVINYVHHQMSAQKNHGNILLYTIAREAHDEEDIRRLEHIVDGVIALHKIYDDEGWQIACQIEKMRGIDFEPKLYLFEVKEGEITLTPFVEFEDEDEEEESEEEEKEAVEQPSDPESSHPPIPPVPEPEDAPESPPETEPEPKVDHESESESTSEPESSSDESGTPSEPIIFDEPKPSEVVSEETDEPEEPENDEEDTFFF